MSLIRITPDITTTGRITIPARTSTCSEAIHITISTMDTDTVTVVVFQAATRRRLILRHALAGSGVATPADTGAGMEAVTAGENNPV
jgi:hypothetical protein